MQVPYNMQVPHEEVHERVSSILKDYGFCPTEEGISIGNLYFLTLLLHCFNDSKFVFKYIFFYLFFEGAIMWMYYPKKSLLTNMVCKHLFWLKYIIQILKITPNYFLWKTGNVDAIKAARETLCQNALEKVGII